MNRSPNSKRLQETPRQKCCIGALYYSQSLMDRNSSPICGGLRKTRKHSSPINELQTESANLAEFKYVCVGYSVYDEERIRTQPDRTNATEGYVNLPQCDGIEVISVHRLKTEPVLLEEGMNGETISQADESQQKKRRGIFEKANELPSFVSEPGKIRWDKFPDRFVRSSNMILAKMEHNARYLMDSVRRLWDR